MTPLLLLLPACNPEFTLKSKGGAPEHIETTGLVSGRACDPEEHTWVEGASVYVNLTDQWGQVTDVRSTTTDASGFWSLAGLPADTALEIYVQLGGRVLDVLDVEIGPGEDFEFPEPDCFDPAALDVAVVTGTFDDFAAVLDSIGILDYAIVDGQDFGEIQSFLLDLDAMSDYDLIYLCGGHLEQGIVYDTDDPDDPVPDQVIQNLRDYVAGGGDLYASDWAYDDIERAWPDALDFVGMDSVPDAAQLGNTQWVDAAVSDERLAAFLDDGGQKVRILYDLPVWPPILSTANTVSTHLSGTVTWRDHGNDVPIAGAPLLVSFNGGGGTVLFSTYRLEANLEPEPLDIVKYVMFEK